MFETSTNCPSLMASPELVSLCPSIGFKTNWPDGHHAASTTWEKGSGSVMTIAPLLAKGTFEIPPHPPDPSNSVANCMDSSFSHPSFARAP